MPFASTAQQRFAFGTKQPWAKRWAKETDFSKIPKRVRKKMQAAKDAGTMPGVMLSGPGGLLATPGMGKRANRKSDDYPDQTQFAGYTMEDWDDTQPDSFYHDTRPRKWGNRRKDKACTCGVNVATKEQLAPGITRIRGNLCNVHGRYGPCDAAQSGKKPPKKGRAGRKPAKPKKPVLTSEQRAQERATQQAANRAAVDKELGITEDTSGALDDLRAGKAVADDGGLVKLGLAEQAADGSYRLTPAGRALAAARAAGDAGRARDIMSAAGDRTAARTERQTAAAERKRVAEERRAAAEKKRAEAAKKKPKAGGGKKPTPGADREVERQSAREQRQREHEQDRARRQREHAEDRAQRQRERSEDRQSQLDARRQRATPPARTAPTDTTTERVPTHTTRVDMPKKRSGPRKRQTTKTVAYWSGITWKAAGNPGDYLIVEDRDHPTTWHLQVRKNGKADHRLMGAAWAALHGGYRGNTYQGPNKAEAISKLRKLYEREGMDVPSEKSTTKALRVVPTGGDTIQGNATAPEAYLHARTYGEVSQSWLDQLVQQGYAYSTDSGFALYEPGELVAKRPELQATFDHIRESNRPDLKSYSFAVFKDDTDAWRWVARTTTAYRDRDGEIITTKALETDAARMTQTKQYGPLRYWHIGNPDPFDPLEPWGAGLDIGDCDYSIVIGRTSIESGTFKSHAIGKAFAENADDYELSPGFFHPPNQPSAAGEYDNIRRFERSVVPVKYGRASNLFTGMTVKEHRMDRKTHEARVKAFLADMNAKGVPEQVAASALAGMQQADKSAEAQGIAYKSDDAPQVFTAPDGTQGIIADGRFVALKAAMAPASMEEAADTEMEDAVEEQADEGDPMADDIGGGEYVGDMSPDDFKAMLAELLAPVLKMQDMVKAMTDMHGELKGMYGGAATKSAEEEAAHQQEIATLKAEQQKLADRLAELIGDQPKVTVPADVEAVLKSKGPEAPQQPAAPQPTLDRPFQGWAAQTWPQLYNADNQQNRS